MGRRRLSGFLLGDAFMVMRIFMWIAVTSLIGLALSSGVGSLVWWAISEKGGWVYTPSASQPEPISFRVLRIAGTVQETLGPTAWTSLAIYFGMRERQRRLGTRRETV